MTAKKQILSKYPFANCRSYSTQITRREKILLYIIWSKSILQNPEKLGEANTAIGAWANAKQNVNKTLLQ